MYGERANGTGGNGEPGQRHAAGLQLHLLLGRQLLQAFVVVDEDEGPLAVGAHGPAQRAVVAFLHVLRCGELRLHRSQHLGIVVHEEVQRAQAVVLAVGLAVLAERSLEVVGAHRQVVVGRAGRCLALVERVQLALGVGAAVVHVVAQQVRAAAQLDHGHGVGVVDVDVRPAMIGGGHAAAQFTGEVGIVVVALGGLCLLLAQQVGADGC